MNSNPRTMHQALQSIFMGASRHRILAITGILAITAFLIRSSHYSDELGGTHAFRQAQTASISELLSQGRGTFLTPTSYLGLPGDAMAVEPPVYQWIAAKICTLSGGYSELKLRLFSTILGLLTGLLLGAFVRNLSGDAMVGWLAAAFYYGAILPAFFHTTPMPDNLILCIVSFALFALSIPQAKPGFGVIAGILASVIAAGLKPPLACGLLATLPLLLSSYFRWSTVFLLWIMSGFLGGLLAITWTIWAQHISAGEYFAFLYTPGFNYSWNLGWQRLFQADFWALMPLRLLQQSCFISLPLAIVALSKRTPFRSLLLLWLGGELMGTLLFPNLNYIHNYYQLRFALLIAVSGSLGWQILLSCASSQRIRAFRNRLTIGVGAISLLLPWPFLHWRHTPDSAQLETIKQSVAEIRVLPAEPCIGLVQQFTFGSRQQFSWDPTFAYLAKQQMYPITEFTVGSYRYDNLDQVARIGFPTILYLTSGDTIGTESASAFTSRLYDYLASEYYVSMRMSTVTIYKKRASPLSH